MVDLGFADFIGLIGAVGYISSYLILQLKREFAKSLSYSVMNFVSALLVSLSLLYDFNMGSMVIQITWMIISSYGMYRCLKYRNKEQAEQFIPAMQENRAEVTASEAAITG